MIGKLACMGVASQLASGVISNLPDELKLDPDIKDPATQAENLMQWEIFRIFYHAVVKAVNSPDWPSPAAALLDGITTPQQLTSLLPAIASILAGPQAVGLITALRGLLNPSTTTTVSGPLPAPGSEIKP